MALRGNVERWAILVMVFAAVGGPVLAAPAYLDVQTRWETVRGVRGIRVDLKGDREPLVQPNGQRIVSKTPLETKVDLKPAPGGFDLLLTLRNGTDKPQPRPRVFLRGIRLGTKFTYLDARDLGTLHQKQVEGGKPIFHHSMRYPDDLYAPVSTFFNDRFAVGMSLLYEPFKAQHGVRNIIYTEGGQWFGTAALGIDLDGPPPKWLPQKGRLRVKPGETETFRFAVRFAKQDRWRDTLEPYREHFRKTYGPVRYKADRRPVFGEPTGLVKFINLKTNPRGYHPKTRIDRVGWKPYIDHLMTAVEKGYRRVMVWCPSGLYSKGDNYAPEFMTEWLPKLVETAGEFDRLKGRKVTVGFWWGRSSQTSGGWNTGRMWATNLDNPKDVAAALAELRLAAERGADEIGLDAFKYIPLWERYDWLQRLQREFPTMRFITESADCDIMHTIAPTFMTYQRQSQAPALADWLNPGHESWILLRWQESNQENFDRVSGWGCVPVTMSIAVKHDASTFVKPAAK